MVSLSISSRSSSVRSAHSQNSLKHVSPSPSSSNFSSSSSSSSSSGRDDDENVTITVDRPLLKKGKERSHEDLQLLAISSRITELSYSISDIQTRIFEIQELRHRSQSSNEANATNIIDQSLSHLDERLEALATGIKSVNESIEPLLQRSEKTPTVAAGMPDEDTLILRKHAAMVAEWEALQKEIQVLREELKEDKWLTVFRTVTDQADGMMGSLEKAVNRCQDFIWQLQRRGMEDGMSRSSSSSSVASEKQSLSFEVFTSLLESFEAKKKHYMPATTKVLSIIDKGVQDRVTKNGECLRRHAESTQRWRNLKERIARTDNDMDAVRKMFISGDSTPPNSSEAGSSTSGTTSKSKTKNGFLTTPPNGSQPMKERTLSTNALSRSMSPFRKLARKITGSAKSPRPTTSAATKTIVRMPISEPARTLRHRASMLHLLGSQPTTPVTPSHKHSQSLTPESSPSAQKLERLEASANANSTLKGKPAWNSSTKVDEDERLATIKSSPRRPSVSSSYRRSDDAPPVPPLYNRSVSRSSMSSSRPWSPVTSSVSTAHSSSFSVYRPPSRSQAHTPGLPMSYRPPSRSQAQTPGLPMSQRPPSRSQMQTPGLPMSPRTRPKTPSHIPAPSKSHFRSMSTSPSDGEFDSDDLALAMQRALSPTAMRSHTPGGSYVPARPPSRSMIPIPSVHVSAASRPSSAMSYHRADSAMSFRASADGARTPDIFTLMRNTPRPSAVQNRLPPSSFRESASPRTPGPGSRPSSRSGADQEGGGEPLHKYVPSNPRDPLDAEVARVVNSLAHILVVERIDPPLRNIPKDGEEIRAQYAFAGPLARKVVTCKLTTLTRPGTKGTSKKVMCRVGGGWQDLHVYVLSRQT